MDLDVEGAVDPRHPDQTEHDGELRDGRTRDVFGEMVGGLGDDGDVDEVVEELEEADRPVGDRVSMWPWRTPEPPLEGTRSLARHGERVAAPSPSRR